MKYNKILLNKILLIFLVFVIAVSACFSNVKASSTKYITANNVTYTLPSEITDNFIIFSVNNEILLVWGDTPYWGVKNCGNDGYGIYNFNTDSGYGTFNNRAFYNQHFYPMGSIDLSVAPSRHYNSNWGVCASPGSSTDVINIIYSSVDIHNESGEIFFQKTPVPVLVEVMSPEVVEKKTIQEILGVLPLILVVVVSFLGLRKVLKMLSTFLNRS